MKPTLRKGWPPVVWGVIAILLALEAYLHFQLKSSVEALDKRVEILEKQSPGLGDYMTTMQLHMGKLWFAGKAANWDLANYELDELKETIEGAQNLHMVINNVKTADVLGSLVDSQVGPLKESIQKHDLLAFKGYYNQTLTACNNCHQSAAHGFNIITIPMAPPVTNQLWEKRK